MSGGSVAIDSSAVLAILREEPGNERLRPKIERADSLAIGAPTLFETAMVAIARFGPDGEQMVEQYGDCMSYATARVAAMPLLFVGNDFAQTDIPPA